MAVVASCVVQACVACGCVYGMAVRDARCPRCRRAASPLYRDAQIFTPQHRSATPWGLRQVLRADVPGEGEAFFVRAAWGAKLPETYAALEAQPWERV